MDNIFADSKKSQKLSRLSYVGFAMLIAILHNLIFWDTEARLGFTLLILIYLSGFTVITLSTKHLRNPWALLLLIPIIVLSLDILLFNNRLVQGAVPYILTILLFLFSVLLTYKNPSSHKFSFTKIPLFRNIFIIFDKLGHVKDDLLNFKRPKSTGISKKIGLALIISLPILLVFGALFASADAIFADWMDKIFDFDFDSSLLQRIVVIAIISVLLSTFFYSLLSEKHKLSEKIISAFYIDKTVVSIVLALINALFLVFVIIQIKYLFGNSEFVLDQGITFANYARSGFFELVWVMILSALIVGIVYRSFSHHGHSIVVNSLQILLVAQVAIIAISALSRMNVYQEAYGYTVLRLYVEWFIYMVLTLLILAASNILLKVKFQNYLYASFGIGLLALTIVSSINVDYLIAKQNIDRFVNKGTQENIALDLNYLNKLSVDIIPAFHSLRSTDLNNNQQQNLENLITNKKNILDREESLMEFNFGREKAKTEIKTLVEKFL